jgi:NTE family protein
MPTTIAALPSSSTNVSLALSGGGVRAVAVHMGVLRYMAEQCWLERVVRISSVSGGSLAVGLVIAKAGKVWPSSRVFLDKVLPDVRTLMCTRSLKWDALSQLKHPGNWKYLFSRANLIATALGKHWGLEFPLHALPQTPVWSINATTAENGRRFRFKGVTIGDYETGYSNAPELPVSTAVAVSAAFPGLIGPLALRTGEFVWMRRKWGEPECAAQKINLDYKAIHLYDGGIYDNLGLEPLFDAGKGIPKTTGDIIIVSDAGAPFGQGFSNGAFSPWRLMRVADIMADQSRNLRVRTFVEYVKKTNAGAFLGIDSPLFDRKTEAAADFTCRFPTTLRQLQPSEFDTLAGHGHAVAKKVHDAYGLGIV